MNNPGNDPSCTHWAGSKDPAYVLYGHAYIPRIFVTVATREIATM